MARVYKVVKAVDDRYYSAVAGDYSSDLTLEYFVGKPVKPRVGNCFAFSSLENAEQFKRSLANRRLAVFSAEAGSAHPITTQIPRLFSSGLVFDEIKLWWSGVWRRVTSYGSQDAPVGTVSCNWIMLKEKVN